MPLETEIPDQQKLYVVRKPRERLFYSAVHDQWTTFTNCDVFTWADLQRDCWNGIHVPGLVLWRNPGRNKATEPYELAFGNNEESGQIVPLYECNEARFIAAILHSLFILDSRLGELHKQLTDGGKRSGFLLEPGLGNFYCALRENMRVLATWVDRNFHNRDLVFESEDRDRLYLLQDQDAIVFLTGAPDIDLQSLVDQLITPEEVPSLTQLAEEVCAAEQSLREILPAGPRGSVTLRPASGEVDSSQPVVGTETPATAPSGGPVVEV